MCPQMPLDGALYTWFAHKIGMHPNLEFMNLSSVDDVLFYPETVGALIVIFPKCEAYLNREQIPLGNTAEKCIHLREPPWLQKPGMFALANALSNFSPGWFVDVASNREAWKNKGLRAIADEGWEPETLYDMLTLPKSIKKWDQFGRWAHWQDNIAPKSLDEYHFVVFAASSVGELIEIDSKLPSVRPTGIFGLQRDHVGDRALLSGPAFEYLKHFISTYASDASGSYTLFGLTLHPKDCDPKACRCDRRARRNRPLHWLRSLERRLKGLMRLEARPNLRAIRNRCISRHKASFFKPCPPSSPLPTNKPPPGLTVRRMGYVAANLEDPPKEADPNADNSDKMNLS